MNRVCKLILFISFFIWTINFTSIVLAYESPVVIINRSVAGYTSDQLRDPFRSYIIKENKAALVQENITAQPEIDLSKFVVQGIIWGGKVPQAIINDQVFTVGDSIEGAKILSIDKKGVKLDLTSGIATLAAPGQSSVSTENNNTPRL